MLFKIHINPEYIPQIKKGIKQHEYRLHKGEFEKMDEGDEMLLYNENGDSVRVKVFKKELFADFEHAVLPYGEEDFNGQYASLEETLSVLNSFYSKEDIKRYGIAVYTMKPIQ